MDFVKFSLQNPVTVLVGVILLILFGCVSLLRIPIQLSPSIEEPTITVRTTWPGATPYEIERDVIEEQEKVLKGIPGLYEMQSTSSTSRGEITLRFTLGTDVDEALLRVSNKLEEVREYPENVDRPSINASGAESSPAVWMVMRTLSENEKDIYDYATFVENDVRQYFDRIPGVADMMISGGVHTQMQVTIDPQRLASYNLTIDEVVQVLRSGNVNISAGNLNVGRRDYRVRSVAEYRTPEEIGDVVISSDGQRVVRVRDVADVGFGFEKLNTPVLTNTVENQRRGITMGVRPEPNTNILDLTDEVERTLAELNEGLLKEHGLYLTIVNEQRPYIRGAIDLLVQNIWVGGLLAIGVLLVFLRSIAPTIVVSVTIPISIIGTFIFLYAFGSTLNVVSLAGIAFGVGMLVDNAIVVLDNIDRHKSKGKSAFQAAYDGTREVWGAVVLGSLTNVAVFLPVIFLQDQAGQLFKDIAVAATCAVMISMVTSITVTPLMSEKAYEWTHRKDLMGIKGRWDFIGWIGDKLSAVYMFFVRIALRNVLTRLATIVLFVGGSTLLAWMLMPKMEYLPQGNRDSIMNVIIPPPGLSYEERYAIGQQLIDYLDPYIGQEKDGYPAVRRIFFIGRDQQLIMGVVSADQMRTRELIPLCKQAIATVPGVFGISNQSSIFQRGIGQGRTITVDLSGPNINQLVADAGAMMGILNGRIPNVQVRPQPALDLLFPEVNFVPDRERLRAVGMTAQQFGTSIDVLMDGRQIGDFKEEGKKKIDLVVRAGEQEIQTPEDLEFALISTPTGQAIPVNAVATAERTSGLTDVRHLERNRTVSLEVTPPYEVTLQEAMEIINEEVVPQMREESRLEGILVGMSGTADKLTSTREALQWNLLLAGLICYLLMAALLGNFLYPFIIMLTVPMGAAGGLLGLKLVNIFVAVQQLDVLTMLGFIILIGVVTNNAILIVYQALENIRFLGMPHKEAILDATQTRLRPIYMSVATSSMGLLPLVLWPGPGSELYRGLGAIILAGQFFSTFLTVFLIPALLMFIIRWEKPRVKEEEKPEAAVATA